MSGSSDNLLWMQNPELAAALRRRQMGEALLKEGADGSPIKSPWQGVNRLAQALIGGYETRKSDEAVTDYAAKSDKEMADFGAMVRGTPQAASPQAPTSPVMPQQRGAAMPALGSPELMGLVAPVAQRYGVPLNLAMALIQQESSGNPGAVGDGGKSVGLGQIQDATARNPGYGVAPMDPAQRTDPAANIDFAMRYLKGKGEALGATDLNDPAHQAIALRGYNGGGDPNYVQNVQSRMGSVQTAGPGAPSPAPEPGSRDLSEAQRLMGIAQQAAQSRNPQIRGQAPILMQQAQMAQQAALARQPQPSEYERLAAASGLAPGTPEYQQAMRAALAKKGAGVNVTVNPNPPQDHRAVYEDGRLSHYEVIPGSATARKIAQEDKKEGKRDAGTVQSGNMVVEDIDRVGKMIDKAFLPATGMGASTLAGIPGTAAHDTAKLLDGIKANIAFDKLQQMRESSPTGGALGAVSDREMALLQATMGSLEQSQSSQQFKENLARLRTMVLDTVHGKGKWQEAPPAGAEVTPTAAPATGGQGGGWSIRPVQ